jgi:hypothetical protein
MIRPLRTPRRTFARSANGFETVRKNKRRSGVGEDDGSQEEGREGERRRVDHLEVAHEGRSEEVQRG